jgi:hypothetical protein
MKRRKLAAVSAWMGTICLLPAPFATAHHAFSAQYDSNQRVTVEGVIVKVEWMNPHAYFFVDVQDEDAGKIVTWACEMGSPAVLVRRGWTRNSLTIGDVVSVDGARARDGSTTMNAQTVVLTSTGQRLFTRDEQREADRSEPKSQ